ncbi:hypothetical protein BDY21DRAFT_284837 [Lineolata rhizophorae]|uniref:ER-bound oxygenase mpaB/mpaB'/Rubber oxygenase catalytic domain-containing protein n=1 Tax=Lineolata rhizophorae TaxID=578093 RepID=A0A6A6P2Z2_9PEZI|nr:hypothetical protein BDY21DRAFT_284837 [Lineolata rhizophorae]
MATTIVSGWLQSLSRTAAHNPVTARVTALAVVLGLYTATCRALRFRRIKGLYKKLGVKTRADMAKMTDREAWEIQEAVGHLEFPVIFEKSLGFALFKTYGIPSISRLLVQTKQLSTPEYAGKRYADTGCLIGEFIANEPSSQRAQEGLARMNYLHSHYQRAGKISNDDMLYTLSLFCLEPMRWVGRYEWREFSELERCAMGVFWKSVGDAMRIEYAGSLPGAETGWKDGIQWLEEIEQWSSEYEEKHMMPHRDNKQTADETLAILLYSMPKSLHGPGLKIVTCLMDDRLRTAMMYPAPPPSYMKFVKGLLNLRAFVLRNFSLPRPDFLAVCNITDRDASGRSHFRYYDAMPFYVKPTLWNRWGPEALWQRLLGLPVPGDSPELYMPEGFRTEEVGPATFKGKGATFYEKDKERLSQMRTGGCPFTHVIS